LRFDITEHGFQAFRCNRSYLITILLYLTLTLTTADYPSTVEDRANLQKEISLMKSLGRHKHIVSIIACCSLGPTPCLVMDYCCHGDLSNYLRKLREKVCIDSGMKCKVHLGVLVAFLLNE